MLILVGVELPLCIVVILSQNANLSSGVQLSIRSFCLISRNDLNQNVSFPMGRHD